MYGKSALPHSVERLDFTGLEVVGTVKVNGPSTDKDMNQINTIGKRAIKKIKGVVKKY